MWSEDQQHLHCLGPSDNAGSQALPPWISLRAFSGDFLVIQWVCRGPIQGQLANLKDLPVGFPGGSAGKESGCNAGELGSTPGLGRSPGEGNSYPLQYSGLENSMDCIVHGVPKSWTWLTFTSLTSSWPLLCHSAASTRHGRVGRFRYRWVFKPASRVVTLL